MREESFYQRLSLLKNVVYISSDVPTFDLIRHCKALATISGTVGWEGLLMGKPAIHFGLAWYASLPGAIRWKGPKASEMALNGKVDRAELAKAYADLTRKAAPGLIDISYAKIIENYSEAEEVAKLAKSIQGQS